jgi:SAM-dependent methyltransferase
MSTISSSADPDDGAAPSCPVCTARSVEEASIAIEVLRRYWKGHFGYDIDAAFARLPDRLHRWQCPDCGLTWFTPPLIGGADLYAKLRTWPDYDRADAWEWPIAIELLKSANVGQMLEIGCGAGAFLAAARDAGLAVEGVDFDGEAIATARARGLAASTRPPSEIADRFDAVLAFQVLEHVADPLAFVRECLRLLKPSGVLILATPNQDGALGRIDGHFLNLPPHHATLWRRSTLLALARRLSLDLVEHRVEPLSPQLHYLYLLQRLGGRPADGLVGKALNLARRALAAVAIALPYAQQRAALGGECQLAVFRKQAA